jgi:transposase
VNEPTGSRPDAASTIFNWPTIASSTPLTCPKGVGGSLWPRPTDPPGCPECGVVAERVDSRRLQRIRDIPVAGAVEMMWATRRWFCIESRSARGTFAESTEQVPRFARSAQRLKKTVVSAVVDCGRAAAEVTRAHRVSWWLVQTALTATRHRGGGPARRAGG